MVCVWCACVCGVHVCMCGVHVCVWCAYVCGVCGVHVCVCAQGESVFSMKLEDEVKHSTTVFSVRR